MINMKPFNTANYPNVWATSDQHFGHKNIIKYENRLIKMGFKQPNEITEKELEIHDNELIRRHNSVVGKRDLVLMLGDVALSSDTDKIRKIMNKLNGSKILIYGNHDAWYKGESLNEFLQIVPYLEFKYNGHFVVACHYPMEQWNRAHHGSYMLFAHCHSMATEFITDKRIHVGVDTNNYYPINLREVIK